MIGLVGLEEQAGTRARKPSGGQQRRLDVGIALVGDPDLLFLDEPTTGFDPSVCRQAWEMVAGPAASARHRAADHPLHGGGPVPRRPGGDHERRADRRPDTPENPR